jgi:uncharacterized protein
MHNIFPSKISSVAIRLRPGDDIKTALDQICKDYKIKAANLLSCCGSLTKVVIRFANQQEPVLLEGHFEIVSLTGSLSENGSHLHICIADETGKTSGGHLKEGNAVYTTAEIVIGILEDLNFSRKKDELTGYPELFIENISK